MSSVPELVRRLGKVHHVALIVRSIEDALGLWRDSLGLELETIMDIESDKVRIAFLAIGESKIELVEPTDDSTGVARFLATKGEGFHHVCFEVANLAETLLKLEIGGLELIDTSPRRGAEGPVAFIHPRACHGVLVELIEAPGGPAWDGPGDLARAGLAKRPGEQHVRGAIGDTTEGHEPSGQLADPRLLVAREGTQLLFDKVDPARRDRPEIRLRDARHRRDPRRIDPLDRATIILGIAIQLDPGVEEVARAVIADDASRGLGEEIQPGRIESAAQRDVRGEAASVVQAGEVIRPSARRISGASPAISSMRWAMTCSAPTRSIQPDEAAPATRAANRPPGSRPPRGLRPLMPRSRRRPR